MYSLVLKLCLIILFAVYVPMHYVIGERVLDTTLAYPSYYKLRNNHLSPGHLRGRGSAAGSKHIGEGAPETTRAGGGPGDPNDPRYQKANTTTERRRTPPYREETLEEQCDYLAKYCQRSYLTGRICARTYFFNYQSFKNYCMMDYVNCMERYEVWQIVHMGQCYDLKDNANHEHFEYQGDTFLDYDVLPNEHVWDFQGYV
ncbi:uncharacterized protein LOC124641714 [Helicoverpa zea]|uniref:uncharacterized protein LOC124641714 n=1 Tax=Helicoverpa zea TaxID=7113 RepID=UPI000B37DC47|nr:uncharacterized protein LOC124641714 [Helicoverpa zea]